MGTFLSPVVVGFPMQFGLNEMAFPHDDRAEAFAVAADAGYDGVEPALDHEDELGNPDALADLRALADDHDLAIPSVLSGLFWEYPLSSTDPETRRRGVELGRELLRAADELGADTVLVVPASIDEDTPYEAGYENALAGVQELAGLADELGLILAVENVWNDFLYSPLEYRSFVASAAEAGPVGAYFDVGNALRFGRPEDWIDVLGDHLAAVHVKDYDTDVDTIDGFTYPLQGDVDWDAVVDALDDADYDGWVTPEVPPYETRGERMPAQVLDNLRAVF
jgi:hexulose-6-phosphate isomerase